MADERPRRGMLVVLAVVVLAAVAGVAFALGGGGDDDVSEEDREVFLEAAASVGPAPFTPTLQPEESTTSTSSSSSTTSTLASGTTARTARGPFGGTGDNRLCDRELLVSFLTDPGNVALAREWARVLDVRVADIPAFVRSLVPTTLTSDARVTNHRWSGGRAVGYQAVLERGTAVLVDVNGRLVARCRCGNPLTPPVEVVKPVYTGPRWEGFDPTVVVVVVVSPSTIFPAPTTTPPTTAGPSDEEEAIRRIREAFESCVRDLAAESDGFLTSGDLDGVLPLVDYSATLVDAPTRTYRVVLVIPGRTLESGENVRGSTATWDVRLSDGEVTPADAATQQLAQCPGLA